MHLRAVNFLVAHGFGNEAIILADHQVSSVRVDVPRAKGVGNLAVPDFTSDQFWVDVIVCDNVHILPEAVEHLVVVLIVHAHVEDIHGGQVAGGSCADHLAVVDDTEIGRAHGIQMLVILVVHEDDVAHPLVLTHKLLDILLSGGACVRADNSGEVIEGASLGGEGGGRRVLEQEFANTLPGSFSGELSFLELVAWCVENDSRVIT